LNNRGMIAIARLEKITARRSRNSFVRVTLAGLN
jgi:hypothetical protein